MVILIKANVATKSYDWGAKGRTNDIGALIGSALVAIGLTSGSVNTDVFRHGYNKFYCQIFRKKV